MGDRARGEAGFKRVVERERVEGIGDAAVEAAGGLEIWVDRVGPGVSQVAEVVVIAGVLPEPDNRAEAVFEGVADALLPGGEILEGGIAREQVRLLEGRIGEVREERAVTRHGVVEMLGERLFSAGADLPRGPRRCGSVQRNRLVLARSRIASPRPFITAWSA